jgi:hypothetical protein
MLIKTIFSIILYSGILFRVSDSIGENDNYYGPYKLEEFPTSNKALTQFTAKVRISYFKEYIKGKMLSVRYYSCSASTNFIGSTKWSEREGKFKISVEEAKDMFERNQCYVISPIKSGTTTFGIGSTYCNDFTDEELKNKRNSWINPTLYTKECPPNVWMKITCRFSFECVNHPVSFPTYVDENQNLIIHSNNGSSIQVEELSKVDDGTYLMFPKEELIKEDRVVFMTCLEDRIDSSFFCSPPKGDKLGVFLWKFHKSDVETQKPVQNRNMIFVIEEMNEAIKDRKKREDQDDRPVSMGDLKNVYNSLEGVELNIETEVTKLQIEIYELRNIVDILVKRLAVKEPTLIGDIIKMPVESVFINQETFFLKRKKDTNFIDHPDSNCRNGEIFQNGVWVKNRNVSNCINLINAKNISLYNTMSSNGGALHISGDPNFTISSNAYDAWNYLNQIRQNSYSMINSGMRLGHGDDGSNGLDLGALSSLIGIFGGGSILIYIGIGLFFILLIRK